MDPHRPEVRPPHPAPPAAPNKQIQWRELWQRGLLSLRRNPFMKLTALLIAIIFWAVLIASDPAIKREKVFTNADVTVSGLDMIHTRGYTVKEDVASMQLQVKMRVNVAQKDYDTVQASTFMPRLDLTKLSNDGGQQRLYFTAGSTTYGQVIEFDPAYIDLHVEGYKRRERIPVDVQQQGSPQQKLWIDMPASDPSQVTVSGPSSLVDKIRRAVAYLPLESLDPAREYDQISVPLVLQDSAGKTIESTHLKITNESVPLDAVVVAANVYPMVELPIDTANAVRGLPAHGYEIGSVQVTPATVLVAGPQATLDRIKSLYVESPLDVQDEKQSQLGGATIRSMPDLMYMSSTEVIIQVEIRQASHGHTYASLPITVMNLPPHLSAKLSTTQMSALLSGNYNDIEALKASQVHLYVDASGLAAGEHVVSVQCRVDGLTDYFFTPETPTVLLTLSPTKP